MTLTVLAALAIFIISRFSVLRSPVGCCHDGDRAGVAIMARFSDDVLIVIGAALFLFIVLFGIPFMRRNVVSGAVIKSSANSAQISATNKKRSTPVRCGGWRVVQRQPGLDKLLAFPKCGLSAREQAFWITKSSNCVRCWTIGTSPTIAPTCPRSLAIHQGQGLLRHDHSETLWRAGIFRAGAFRSGEQSCFA